MPVNAAANPLTLPRIVPPSAPPKATRASFGRRAWPAASRVPSALAVVFRFGAQRPGRETLLLDRSIGPADWKLEWTSCHPATGASGRWRVQLPRWAPSRALRSAHAGAGLCWRVAAPGAAQGAGRARPLAAAAKHSSAGGKAPVRRVACWPRALVPRSTRRCFRITNNRPSTATAESTSAPGSGGNDKPVRRHPTRKRQVWHPPAQDQSSRTGLRQKSLEPRRDPCRLVRR